MMDHAEARSDLADLVLEPARLRLLAGPVEAATMTAADAALLDHIATCPACASELVAWRRTLGLLDAAMAGADGRPRSSLSGFATAEAGSTAIELPPDLRERTLASVRSAGVARPWVATRSAAAPVGRVSGARRMLPAWLALAAVVAILVVGAGLLLDRGRQLESAQTQARELAAVVSRLDGILQEPGHQTSALTSSTGAAAGSVAFGPSSGDIVVVTHALDAPPAGFVYRCWIESGGSRTAIGEMIFSGSTAYWAGSLAGWGGGVAPGERLGVSLEPAAGGVDGQPVLVATF